MAFLGAFACSCEYLRDLKSPLVSTVGELFGNVIFTPLYDLYLEHFFLIKHFNKYEKPIVELFLQIFSYILKARTESLPRILKRNEIMILPFSLGVSLSVL